MPNNVVLSFSGGKDSCFALYKLQKQNIHVSHLVTTVWQESSETVAHQLSTRKLIEQAEQLNIPITFIKTTFETYRDDFLRTLKQLKEKHQIDGIAFGDMYIKGHQEWGEQLATDAKLKALYPLWTEQNNMLNMLAQFVHLKFSAKVIKVDEELLPTSWIGRSIDSTFIKDIQAYDNVCPMGESGEYHTHVYDGPIFTKNK